VSSYLVTIAHGRTVFCGLVSATLLIHLKIRFLEIFVVKHYLVHLQASKFIFILILVIFLQITSCFLFGNKILCDKALQKLDIERFEGKYDAQEMEDHEVMAAAQNARALHIVHAGNVVPQLRRTVLQADNMRGGCEVVL